MTTLHFPPSLSAPLEPYLPPGPQPLPHLTLTFATSLDSAISLRPGTQTVLSGSQSKAMTHHLRSRHAAILVGAGTAVADDPGLNCRIDGCGIKNQPRPVVLDPRGRWMVSGKSKVVELAREGKGLGPWILVREGTVVDETRREAVEGVGGRYISLPCWTEGDGFAWRDVLGVLKREGLESVMVEGGGTVINSLLEGQNLRLVSSVIVTIAPTWLGRGGVVVSPERPGGEAGSTPAARLVSVKWCPLGDDMVLCGRPVGG